MPRFVKEVVVLPEKLLVDGEEFPWYIKPGGIVIDTIPRRWEHSKFIPTDAGVLTVSILVDVDGVIKIAQELGGDYDAKS
jgi:hypothetical protein